MQPRKLVTTYKPSAPWSLFLLLLLLLRSGGHAFKNDQSFKSESHSDNENLGIDASVTFTTSAYLSLFQLRTHKHGQWQTPTTCSSEKAAQRKTQQRPTTAVLPCHRCTGENSWNPPKSQCEASEREAKVESRTDLCGESSCWPRAALRAAYSSALRLPHLAIKARFSKWKIFLNFQPLAENL